jgi:putative peptide zinc metalloprotease protein
VENLAAPADVRPRVRPDVVFGPALRQAATVVHHVRDQRTGWFFRIGPKEHFVFTRLDGTRTLEEIGGEYAAHFGRRLGPAQWGQLLGLLASRRLLVGTEDEAALEAAAAAAATASRGNRRLTYARLPLFDPNRFLGRVEPRLRFLYARPLVVAVLVAIVAMEVLVFTRIPTLYGDLRRLWTHTPLLGVLALVVSWGTLALHETAHGLTCKHYGGQVREIGLMWRFPLVAPYCKADDVVLFPNRWHRVYTALAGVYTGLMVLIPFAVLYVLTPSGEIWHGFAATVLVMGSSSAVVNLVPFLQLDGYFILNHSLNMVNLRVESYRYCARLVRALRRRDSDEPAVAYPPSVRTAYLFYGIASVLFGAGLLCTLVVVWFIQISNSLGPWPAAGILTGEALVLTVVAQYFRRRLARASTDRQDRAA